MGIGVQPCCCGTVCPACLADVPATVSVTLPAGMFVGINGDLCDASSCTDLNGQTFVCEFNRTSGGICFWDYSGEYCDNVCGFFNMGVQFASSDSIFAEGIYVGIGMGNLSSNPETTLCLENFGTEWYLEVDSPWDCTGGGPWTVPCTSAGGDGNCILAATIGPVIVTT